MRPGVEVSSGVLQGFIRYIAHKGVSSSPGKKQMFVPYTYTYMFIILRLMKGKTNLVINKFSLAMHTSQENTVRVKIASTSLTYKLSAYSMKQRT